MSVLGTMQMLDPMAAAPKRPARNDDAAPPPSWTDGIAASFRVARDDQFGHLEEEEVNAFAPLIDELRNRKYDVSRYYELSATRGSLSAINNKIQPGRIYADIEAERRKDPAAFAASPKSLPEFEAKWRGDLRQRQQRDARVVAQTNLVPWLIGSLGGGATDPLTLASMFIGGGEATLLRQMAVQGGVNTAITAGELPLVQIEREKQGRRKLTAAEGATMIALGTVLGAAFPAAIRGGGIAARGAGGAAGKAAGRVYDAVVPFDIRAARALEAAVPRHAMSPNLAAAVNVLTRDAEIRASNPFAETHADIDAHAQKVNEALARIEAGLGVAADDAPIRPGRAAGMGRSAAGDIGNGRGAAIDGYMAAARRQESGGSDAARNPRSSATGRYQFTEGTWTAYYRKTFPQSGLSDEAILARRADEATQDRVMRRFTEDNAAFLEARGAEVSAGNLYVVHHLGQGGAKAVLDAAPGAALRDILPAGVISANPHLANMTAGRFIAWADGRMGGDGGMAGGIPDMAPVESPAAPVVRPDALDTVRPQVAFEGRDVPLAQFRPDEIGVDAALMQFKSGGDQFGVTERLQGVEQWDPMAAGVVTVWEGLDGRRLIADGHQRLELAGRIQAADPAQAVTLNAFVLREADGFSAADARVLTALKNIGEGTGTAIDAAKVFRALGAEGADDLTRRLPPKSALVRDGKALARLSPEAFGAAIKEVIPEGYAAAIGHLADDPATHAGLVALLNKIDPPNRRQAESVIRQALDAGFTREEQIDMFGSSTAVTSLFAQKARVLDKTLSELRKLKGAFSVAARNADALDAAGNRIDVDASQAAADGNARALDLVNALALRKGNAVNAIFNDAAERLARGDSLADVTRDTVRQLGELDLANVARDVDGREAGSADGAGGGLGGSGRGDIAADADGAAPESAELTPATRDELEAAGQGGFAMFDEEAGKAFDDPAGDGIAKVADSAWHDAKAAVGTGQSRTLQTAKSAKLADQAPIMWRETNLKRAEEFLPGASFADNGIGGNSDVFLADTPTMALGQGVNTGVMLEFSTADLSGTINKKPGWDYQYLAGQGSEFVANNPGAKYQSALRSIKLSKKAMAEAEALSAKFDYAGTGRRSGMLKVLDDLEAAGWAKTETTNGVKYTKPSDGALDSGAAVDPNIAVKTRQEADIAAQQPLGGARKTGAAQDPAMPEGLFGGAQEPTFDLGDGKGARTLADIENELNAEDAGIAAIRDCQI